MADALDAMRDRVVARRAALDAAGPCDRCGEPGTTSWADDICTVCPHVPLCDRCRAWHLAEAIEDGTAR